MLSKTENRNVVRETQAAMIWTMRAESCLDRRIPLAYPPRQNPRDIECGVTVQTYFAAKHKRGERGKFWPLHILAAPNWRQRDARDDLDLRRAA